MNQVYQLQQEIQKFMLGQPTELPEQTKSELSVYYSLVVSSLSSLMQNIYPLSRKIIGEDWDDLMRHYQNNYPSKSAIYNRLAADFYKLLSEEDLAENFPNFLSDLARYEWTEVLIHNSPDLAASSKLTPVHKIEKFSYPVTQVIEYLKTTEDDIESLRQTDIEEESEIVFFYRDHESLKNRSFVLSNTTLFVIEAIGSGKGLEEIHQSFCAHFGLKIELSALEKLIGDLQEANILID
ncbi:MAG: putative DNA-binding domain-containing protein [Candidatus Melainabacteria bacterium]|nr:putative DNA-binding domain-containing protein [Candidatus Melainabacteria bacterium]